MMASSARAPPSSLRNQSLIRLSALNITFVSLELLAIKNWSYNIRSAAAVGVESNDTYDLIANVLGLDIAAAATRHLGLHEKATQRTDLHGSSTISELPNGYYWHNQHAPV